MLLPRVKDMVSFKVPDHHVLVTASNDGFIKMWTLTQDKVSVRPTVSTLQCRPDCIITSGYAIKASL